MVTDLQKQVTVSSVAKGKDVPIAEYFETFLLVPSPNIVVP